MNELTREQLVILRLMKDDWELAYIEPGLARGRTRTWLQKDGTGLGGASVNVDGRARAGLERRGYLDRDDRRPKDSITIVRLKLTESGMARLRKEFSL